MIYSVISFIIIIIIIIIFITIIVIVIVIIIIIIITINITQLKILQLVNKLAKETNQNPVFSSHLQHFCQYLRRTQECRFQDESH